MLTRLKTLASLYRELGLRWSAFRVAYAIRLRTGLIRLQMPVGEWEAYKDLVPGKSAGRAGAVFFHSVSRPGGFPSNLPWNPQSAIIEADRIMNGELKYFAHEWINTGFPPDWHHDDVTLNGGKESPSSQSEILRLQQTAHSHRPDAHRENDMMKHWSQISDDSNSDIKFIWEPNRFAFVYPLVRAYAFTKDDKYAEAYWALIEDWAKHNPPNTGPNWMDGQEVALRLMAWTFGYHAFLNSPSIAPERKENFMVYIATQAERIYKNIGYAISTRSNHTISEAFGLWLAGLHFPYLKNSERYLSLGRRLLENEAAAQIFPDGTYSMYSLNYHRFILQIYLYAIRLGELNEVPFSDSLKRTVAKSIEYLAQLIDPGTGQMPAYGSNDGALVLPLNNCDFTDYRPLLQLGWFITKGERLFEPGPWDEDVFWLCGKQALIPSPSPAGRREPESPSPLGRGVRGEGEVSFPHGGVYLLRGSHSRALIRCTDFTSRPSHADQLHVDLWVHGHNIAVDAGSYLYSGDGIWRNGLAHTSVHNTVTVDGRDQMTMVTRFTWADWSSGEVLNHEKDLWQGEHDGYKPVIHKRTVMALEGDRWLVIDHLAANEPHRYALHWLLNDFPFEQRENSVLLSLDELRCEVQVGMVDGYGDFSLVRAEPTSTRGWRSRYYGHREPALSLVLEARQAQVTFWTVFGFENDAVELTGNILRVNSREFNLHPAATD